MACLFFIRDLEFSPQLSKVRSRTNNSQKLVHGGGSIPFNNSVLLPFITYFIKVQLENIFNKLIAFLVLKTFYSLFS